MRHYAIKDILTALQITKFRLTKLAKHLAIQPHQSQDDGRYWLFSESEYRQIQALHKEWLAERGMGDTDSLESLRTQLDSAQREIRRLMMQNTPSSTEATSAPRQRVRSGFTAHREEVPAGYVRTGKFAEDHGVPEATARGHIRNQKFSETTEQIPTRPDEVYHFLSAEQQEAAIVYWRGHYSRYHACEDVGCVCHSAG